MKTLFRFFDTDDFIFFATGDAKSEKQFQRAISNRLYQFFIFARYYKNLRDGWRQFKAPKMYKLKITMHTDIFYEIEKTGTYKNCLRALETVRRVEGDNIFYVELTRAPQ